jgi:hypothetical protein
MRWAPPRTEPGVRAATTTVVVRPHRSAIRPVRSAPAVNPPSLLPHFGEQTPSTATSWSGGWTHLLAPHCRGRQCKPAHDHRLRRWVQLESGGRMAAPTRHRTRHRSDWRIPSLETILRSGPNGCGGGLTRWPRAFAAIPRWVPRRWMPGSVGVGGDRSAGWRSGRSLLLSCSR